jgi:hypothetical protein
MKKITPFFIQKPHYLNQRCHPPKFHNPRHTTGLG